LHKKAVRLHNDKKDYEQALELYNRVLEIDPTHNKAWKNKATASRCLSKFEESLKAYDVSIEMNPDRYDLFYYRGFVKNKLKMTDEAEKDLEKCLELKEDDASAWKLLG